MQHLQKTRGWGISQARYTLTKHPTRMLILRSPPRQTTKELSSHPTSIARTATRTLSYLEVGPMRRRLIRIALILLLFPPLLAAVAGWLFGPAFLHSIRPHSRRRRGPHRHLRFARTQRHPRHYRRIGPVRSRPLRRRATPIGKMETRARRRLRSTRADPSSSSPSGGSSSPLRPSRIHGRRERPALRARRSPH